MKKTIDNKNEDLEQRTTSKAGRLFRKMAFPCAIAIIVGSLLYCRINCIESTTLQHSQHLLSRHLLSEVNLKQYINNKSEIPDTTYRIYLNDTTLGSGQDWVGDFKSENYQVFTDILHPDSSYLYISGRDSCRWYELKKLEIHIAPGQKIPIMYAEWGTYSSDFKK